MTTQRKVNIGGQCPGIADRCRDENYKQFIDLLYNNTGLQIMRLYFLLENERSFPG